MKLLPKIIICACLLLLAQADSDNSACMTACLTTAGVVTVAPLAFGFGVAGVGAGMPAAAVHAAIGNVAAGGWFAGLQAYGATFGAATVAKATAAATAGCTALCNS